MAYCDSCLHHHDRPNTDAGCSDHREQLSTFAAASLEWLDDHIRQQQTVHRRMGVTRSMLSAAAEYTEEMEVLSCSLLSR